MQGGIVLEREEPARGRFVAAAGSFQAYVLVGLVAFCVLTTMAYTLRKGSRIGATYSGQFDASVMVRFLTAMTHVRLEEIIMGDHSPEEIGDVWHYFDAADWYAGALLDGGTNSEGEFLPLSEASLRTLAERTRGWIGELREIAQTWYGSAYGPKAAGSAGSVHDKVFMDIVIAMEELESRLREALAAELATFRAVQTVLIVVTVGLAAVVALVLHRSSRIRAQDWVTIRRINGELTERIGAHERAEEALGRQTKFLGDVLESLTHPFYVIDPSSHVVILANSAARKEGFVVGAVCYAVSHGADRPCEGQGHPCPVLSVMNNGQPAVAEHCHQGPDGGTRYVEVHAFPVVEPDGRISQTILYALDVSARRRAEQKQAESIRLLEGVNRELDEFAYVVSHDLKAPLRGVKTLVGWIMADYADKLDAEGREHLDLLVRRVERMHNLIDGVLQYSRAGRSRENAEAVELSELVPQIVDAIAAPEHIHFAIQEDLPTLVAEPTQMTQLFQNLVSNAVKYMDKPEGRIGIAFERDGAFWKFSVSDNGPGIAAEHFERIFGLFQTLAPKDEYESTGIGLSLVKKIVTRYGGAVWLESEVGRGTTFFFTLPVEGRKNPGSETADAGETVEPPMAVPIEVG